jgi:HEAT repeat protein
MRGHIAWLFALSMSITTTSWCADRPSFANRHCTDISSCELWLREEAAVAPHGGVDPSAEVLAEDFHRLGDAGWRRIAALTLDSDPGIRNVAGYVMSEWSPIGKDKLPDVEAAMLKEPGGWPAGALDDVNDRKAIAMLIRDVHGTGTGQATGALMRSAPASLRPIISALQQPDSDDLRRGIEDELRMASEPGTARSKDFQKIVEALTVIAVDRTTSEAGRLQATMLLDSIAPIRNASIAALRLNLHAADPKLRSTTEHLLIAQGDSTVLGPLITRCRRLLVDAGLPRGPYVAASDCLDPLARMGKAGAIAAPMLLERARKLDDRLRIEVLVALGYLGDPSAIPVLVEYLKSDDERVVAASLESLWRLRAKGQIQDIRAVARSYWYVPIKTFASNVASALSGGPSVWVEGAIARVHERQLTAGYLTEVYRLVGVHNVGCKTWKQGNTVASIPDGRASASKDATMELNPNAHSQPLGKGILIGTDRGEWSGDLLWVPRDGKTVRLAKDNVSGMWLSGLGEAMVVLGGDGMIDGGGEVLRIAVHAGVPAIVARRRLPSAPARTFIGDFEGFLVVMESHEAVFVRRDLTYAQADCADP